MSRSVNKQILITSGEPAGIGPDLCLLAAAQNALQDAVVIGCPILFAERAAQLGIDVAQAIYPQRAALTILPLPTRASVTAGELNPANAAYVLNMLRSAATRVSEGEFAALMTAPIHKGVINDSGVTFSGHTEFFQALAEVDKVVMMLACADLRVALVTTHLPLRDVVDAITAEAIRDTVRITEQALRDHFALPKPRIAVCGLNPHAGEQGHLGDEELRVITPTLNALRKQGLDITGPLPADTLFVPRYSDQYDAIIAMYHDQGLPVLKARGFGQAVNITLGLPYIRTSVDHGTALDLAGSGQIDTGSFLAALELAQTLNTDKDKCHG
ncbi:4-hydroxythreonine-4-phosphate dehydrogenase PdxA [Suttonella sp. R2A3]|uniref:4-hydroxythreonine-4-phosphate dehydrogenase PdxA n=1 Tax=Suttonella sp. R2A3 TaxID=2908648 RepID=UPI001F2DD081|nr:4-hydroxythreonine-4-phosphate dehydrogenase PdxA [Suttonella sp. R2A3]UJF25389.1 4-hydroxythreonine-4-phosphate dehydrogenase PdxA [Suttonella sp. R2A3]